MPPAIIAVAAAVGTWAVSTYVTSVILAAVLIVAINVAATMLTRKPKNQNGNLNQGQELRLKLDANMPRQLALGRTATGGSLAAAFTYGATSEVPNRYLVRIISISDLPINAVVQIKEGKDVLSFSGDVTTGLQACNQHRKKNGSAAFHVKVVKGSPTAVADPDLRAMIPSLWTTAHKGINTAYIIQRSDYDPDAFPNGEPQLTIVVDGVSVYDDRFDSSNGFGTGTQRLNNPATWAFSRNSAVLAAQCLRGFKSNGVAVYGVQAESRDLAPLMVAAAANTCDEAVATATEGTIPRYRAGLMVSASEAVANALIDLQASFDGRILDRGGAITLLPGAIRSAVFHLTDNDVIWIKESSWQAKASLQELTNHMTGVFVDEAAGYAEQAFPTKVNAQWELDDGGERFTARYAFGAVNSRSQVQRIVDRMYQSTRFQGTVAFVMPLYGIEAEQGDWFTMTSARKGFTNKWFEIAKCDITTEMSYVIIAREVSPTVAGWGPSNEVPRTDVIWNPPSSILLVPVLTLTNIIEGVGTLMMHMDINVDVSGMLEGTAADSILMEYAVAGQEANPKQVPLLKPTNQNYVIPSVQRSATYGVRARTQTRDGAVSNWSAWTYITTLASDSTIPTYAGSELNQNSSFEQFEVGAFPGWSKLSGSGTISQLPSSYGGHGQHSALLSGSVAIMSELASVAPGQKLFTYLRDVVRLGRAGTQAPGDTAHVYALFRIYADASKTRYFDFPIRNASSANPDGIRVSQTSFVIPANPADAEGRGAFVPTMGQLIYALENGVPVTSAAAIIDRFAISENQPGADVTETSPVIAALLADNVLSRSEKPEFIDKWTRIQREHFAIVAASTTFTGIDQLRTSESNTYSALEAQIAAISPAYDNLAVDSPTPSNLPVTFSNWYSAYSALSNALQGRPFGMVAHGATENIQIIGNRIKKISGANSWDSGVYSAVSFVGGASVSWRAVATNTSMMIGLDGFPSENASFTSIDWAIHLIGGGTTIAYESGSPVAGSSAVYAVGDTFEVRYEDGGQSGRIRYLKNGVDMIAPRKVNPGLALYFDSSFASPGGEISDIAWTPLSAQFTPWRQEATPTARFIGDKWFKPTAGIEYWWDGDSWEITTSYGATAAQVATITQAIGDAANAVAIADGKIDTFYQPAAPAGTLGDLWFDTADGNKQYRHNGNTWVPVQDQSIGLAITAAAGAQATADGKVRTFIAATAPVATGIGDLWFDTASGILKRWNGSTWVSTADDTAANSPSISGLSKINIAANSSSETTTLLPQQRRVTAFRGTTEVTATWEVVSISTPAIEAAFGSGADANLLSVTKANAAGTITVRATFSNGAIVGGAISIERTVAPPSTGGGGSGGTTTVTDASFDNPATTTHATVSDVMTVKASASGQLLFSVVADYVNGGGTFPARLAVKPRYRLASSAPGGAWTDAGAEVVGSNAYFYTSTPPNQLPQPGDESYPVPGEVLVNQTITTLTASQDYQVDLQARRAGAGNPGYWQNVNYTVRQP